MKKNYNNSCYGNDIPNITSWGFSKTDFSLEIKSLLDSRCIDSHDEIPKFTSRKWPSKRIVRNFSPERTISDRLLNFNALIHFRE